MIVEGFLAVAVIGVMFLLVICAFLNERVNRLEEKVRKIEMKDFRKAGAPTSPATVDKDEQPVYNPSYGDPEAMLFFDKQYGGKSE